MAVLYETLALGVPNRVAMALYYLVTLVGTGTEARLLSLFSLSSPGIRLSRAPLGPSVMHFMRINSNPRLGPLWALPFSALLCPSLLRLARAIPVGHVPPLRLCAESHEGTSLSTNTP